MSDSQEQSTGEGTMPLDPQLRSPDEVEASDPIDLYTTATRLPFEPPSPPPMTGSGRPRRAAAPATGSMLGVGPPIEFAKSRRNKRKISFNASDEDDEEEGASPERKIRPSGGTTKRRRSGRRIRQESTDEEASELSEPPSSSKSSKKKDSAKVPPKSTTSIKVKDDEDTKPAKVSDSKRKADAANALLGRKGKGRPIPNRVQDCDPADMMMWQWRNSGKTWNEIRMEYERLTDTKPGRSSLSVRLAKMQDNFIDSGGRDDMLLLSTKERIEAQLEKTRWQMISDAIKESLKTTTPAPASAGKNKRKKAKKADDQYTPEALRKRYNAVRESGWLLGEAVDEASPPGPATPKNKKAVWKSGSRLGRLKRGVAGMGVDAGAVEGDGEASGSENDDEVEAEGDGDLGDGEGTEVLSE